MEGFINDFKCLDCRHCFNRSKLFQLLSKSELELLNDTRLEVTFKKGEIIYKQGTPLTHIVIIRDGYGKIILESPKGRNLILCYTNKYDINGGIGLFIDLRHHSSLVAVTDCVSCFVEVNAFKTVMRSNLIFLETYIKEYSERVLHTYKQISILTQKNMEGRMAESILYLNDHSISNGSIPNVSRQDLAELTAMTKESAIRVLKGFKVDGLIEIVDHNIYIRNVKGLEQVSQHG